MMLNKHVSSRTDELIFSIYNFKKNNIKQAAKKLDAELTMELIFDAWMFMNSFRNCDLKFYYDEELHLINNSLNQHRFDVNRKLLRPKKSFRIAFLMSSLSDTGGASIPHRFILDDYSHPNGYKFEQYLLITNLGRKDIHLLKESHQYQYIKNDLNLTEYEIMPPIKSWVERGKYIEQWLYEREIDFVVVDPEPSILYALSSSPVLLKGILSQDCYSFALGPGAGDVTFYVTPDQIFKYHFNQEYSSPKCKVLMLPIHNLDYVQATEPLNLEEYGIPKGAVVSATTNMWKACLGDTEMLLEGISDLVRKFPHYHHIFAGTPRCLENIEYFLHKNIDIKNNLHYIGPIKNIYRLLKSINFYINSFPISGGSDLESALVGKPSIEFIWNRNLTLHGCEFLRSPECEVLSIEEFIKLGSRLIEDGEYAQELGRFLQQKVIREFDKNRLIKERIYDYFIEEFHKKMALTEPSPTESVVLNEALEYEKHIALYNAFGRENWDIDQQRKWLEECITNYPEKPFGWVRCFELAISSRDKEWFLSLAETLPVSFTQDPRLLIMMSLGHEVFGDHGAALDKALVAANLSIYDKIPARVAARLLIAAARNQEAAAVLTNAKITQNINPEDVQSFLRKLPPDNLPLYYDY